MRADVVENLPVDLDGVLALGVQPEVGEVVAEALTATAHHRVLDAAWALLDKALRHRTLRALGASRCLYGSDGPYGYPARDGGYDHGVILRQISQAGRGAEDLDRVLGGNFKALAAV